MMNVGELQQQLGGAQEDKGWRPPPHIMITESMNKLENDNFTFKITNRNVSNNRRNGKRMKKCLQDLLGCEGRVNQ